MNQTELLNYNGWRNRIRFTNEYVTPGSHPIIWDEIGLPRNMNNKSYFETGAWDGGYAFEAENRGADEIMASDLWGLQNFDGSKYSHNPSRQGFDLMHEFLNSSVKSLSIDIVDVTPETVGKWDIVNCMSVLSWTNFPIYILKNLASITEDSLYLTVALQSKDRSIPNISMYSKPDGNDYNERWVMNKTAMRYILHKYCGFRNVEFRRLNYFSYRTFGIIGTRGCMYSDFDLTETNSTISRGTIVEIVSDMGPVVYLRDLRNQTGWAKKTEINLHLENKGNGFDQLIKSLKSFKDRQRDLYNHFLKLTGLVDGPTGQVGYAIKATKE